jgi:hypothetical protein
MRYVNLFKIILLLLPLFNLHCKGTTESEFSFTNVVYFNSFENESDLKNWEGLTTQNLVENPSPYGGKHSVYISGGCVIPHASLTLKAPGKDILVTLEFYSKNLAIGGGIELIMGRDFFERLCVTVDDTTWKKCRSDQSLKWPADSTMSIWMSAGGIVASSMLIDELKILKID